MDKRWEDVKDVGAIERIKFEIEALKEKVDMLTGLIPEGQQNWGMPGLIQRAMMSDIQMLESEICTIQEKPKPVDMTGDITNGNIRHIPVPMLIDDGMVDDDQMKREWWDYASNCGQNEGYEDEGWMETDDFMDWVYGEITAAMTNAVEGKCEMVFCASDHISDEAIAWAFNYLCYNHKLY